MNNSFKENFEDSNELRNSIEDITPIYLDAHGEESRLRMVELTTKHGRIREDDILKINFLTTPATNTYEPIAESGLLFLDPHGDPDVHHCIVELAKKYGRDPNLLKIDETKNQNFDE